jgi:hypothetical protein
VGRIDPREEAKPRRSGLFEIGAPDGRRLPFAEVRPDRADAPTRSYPFRHRTTFAAFRTPEEWPDWRASDWFLTVS